MSKETGEGRKRGGIDGQILTFLKRDAPRRLESGGILGDENSAPAFSLCIPLKIGKGFNKTKSQFRGISNIFKSGSLKHRVNF